MNVEEPQFQQLVSTSTSRIQLWEQILRATNVETMLEVGVWKGDYAKQICFAFIDTTGKYGDISLNKVSPGANRSAIQRQVKRLLARIGLGSLCRTTLCK